MVDKKLGELSKGGLTRIPCMQHWMRFLWVEPTEGDDGSEGDVPEGSIHLGLVAVDCPGYTAAHHHVHIHHTQLQHGEDM